MEELLVWVHDKEGKEFLCVMDRGLCDEFVCIMDGHRDIPKTLEELSDNERSSCWDVSELAGNGRW